VVDGSAQITHNPSGLWLLDCGDFFSFDNLGESMISSTGKSWRRQRNVKKNAGWKIHQNAFHAFSAVSKLWCRGVEY